MRISRPSAGTILGATAVFIALGGTAFAAGATVVNIADPTTPANVAHVTSAGALQTTGSTNVTNTVTSELAAPSAYIYQVNASLAPNNGCVVLAQPPSGKAMIVRDVNIDAFADPSPGSGQFVRLYSDNTCTDLVATVNPGNVGETVLPFDPGLGIPAKSFLSAMVAGSVQAEVDVEGYSVPSSAVPATAPGAGRVMQQQH